MERQEKQKKQKKERYVDLPENRMLLAKSCRRLGNSLLFVFWLGVFLVVLYGMYRLYCTDPKLTPDNVVFGLMDPLTTTIIVVGVVLFMILEILALVLIFRTKRLEKSYPEHNVGRLWLMFALGMVCVVTSVYGGYEVRGTTKEFIKLNTF